MPDKYDFLKIDLNSNGLEGEKVKKAFDFWSKNVQN